MGLRVACLCRVGLVLMLPWHSHQIFGIALVALILFGYFYLQAQGKVAALNATFVITGVTLVPAFGAGSMDGGVEFAKGLAQSALGASGLCTGRRSGRASYGLSFCLSG